MPANAFFPGGVLAMPGGAADKLLAQADGDAALLYLWLLRAAGRWDPAAAARTLRWAPDRAEGAYAALVKLGLADPAAPAAAPQAPAEPDEPPEYTAADITKELEDAASPFPGLVREVQRRLGKILSTADLKILYCLYDYLALPAEVVMLLVSYCVEEMERKYGPGRKPRLSQVRREGFAWKRLGVDTTQAAEAHLRKCAALRTREGALLPLLDIKGRPPVEGERKYIAAWVDMGFEDEAVRLAYERTVLKKGAMNWPYMNSILKSWHQKGLHTVAAVEAGDSNRPAAPAQGGIVNPPSPAAPGETERRVQEDLERMREFMKRQREQEGG